mmetsp:Transcript_10850/g.19769  ORF Transcript_10850/g.19769 Transcript_10850/m.19769 type:complete len:106 (-) Transcript_10850:2328-2645(-)
MQANASNSPLEASSERCASSLPSQILNVIRPNPESVIKDDKRDGHGDEGPSVWDRRQGESCRVLLDFVIQELCAGMRRVFEDEEKLRKTLRRLREVPFFIFGPNE